MRAFLVARGSTGIDGLKRVELETPQPAPREVQVRLRAASLNFRDIAVLNGKYVRGPLERDTVPLSDGAGEVSAVGTAVSELAVGDRVVATFTQGRPPEALGSPLDGTLREYAVFEPEGLLRLPEHLSFEEAATLPCAGVTAWNALFEGRRLLPGQTVLTLGTGGVSILALQLAKMAGARVIITSSSDEKLARARELGADDVINYRITPDWSGAVLAMTDGRGAEQVVETAAFGTLPQSYRAVAAHGEIALLGVLTRATEDLTPHPLMFKHSTLRGLFVGDREHFERLLRAIAVNRMRPVVDRVFAFDEAQQAYEYLKSRQHFGKVVIKI